VFIPGVTSDMMGLIIDYAYTRDTDVTAENVERLLPAADQFHVLGLVKRCCDYLAEGLDVDNCIGIRNFARSYFCNNLERIANRFDGCGYISRLIYVAKLYFYVCTSKLIIIMVMMMMMMTTTTTRTMNRGREEREE